MLKNIMKRSEGFTLVELLVVIVVIGVLAAIAIPVFLSQADKANLASAQADVANIAKLVQADYADDAAADISGALSGSTYTSVGGFGSVVGAGTITIDTGNNAWCVESVVGGQTASYDHALGLQTAACPE